MGEHTDPKKNCLQGVATWVRDDLPMIGATQRVTGLVDIDQQGRALLTDHGSFAVVNVYAHHVGDSEQALRDKMRFLTALTKRICELRAQGKRVLLCGDLNLTHRILDQRSERRLLWFDAEGSVVLPDGAEAVQVTDWSQTWVPVTDVSTRLKLPMEQLAPMGECLHIREKECVDWLRGLVTGGIANEVPNWADVFAEVHPTAQDRFTCWSTMQNTRYINYGT